MKKLLWMLAIGIMGLTAGLGYFLWERATAVPDWYAETSDEPSPTPVLPSPSLSSPSLASSPTPSVASPSVVVVTGSPSVLVTPSSVLTPSASPTPTLAATPKALPTGVRSLKTQVQQNELRSGALVDLAQMETATPSKQTALVQKLLVVMPQLRGKKVFLGVRGQIVEQNGQRQLAADSQLSIGKVELPLDEVAAQMSMTRADLDRMILSYLQLDKPPSKAP